MKKLRLFFVSVLFLFFLTSNYVWAQLLEENFDFSGQLTSNGWSAHSGAGTNPLSTTTGLTFTDYPGSGIGNAVLIGNAGGEDDNRDYTLQNTNGDVVYYSFLINVNESASNKTGDYFIHIGNRVSATNFTLFAARVFAKITSDNVNFGLSNTSTATYGTTNYSKNTTYLLIVKYTINTGGNDETKLWVVASGIPSSEVAAGTPEVTNTTTAGQDALNAVGIRQGSSTNSPQVVLDGIRIATTWGDLFPPAGVSTIVVSPTSLSGFTYLVGAGPSTSQRYDLSGSNLTPASDSLTVAGSTNYEVSLDSLTFGSSVKVAYSGSTLSATPVYVRLKVGLSLGQYNGEFITNAGGGATTQNVTCNGAVIKSEPSSHVTSFTGALGNPPYYYNNLSWVDATGGTVPDGYLIKRSSTDFSSITDPVDGVPESNTFSVQNIVQGIQAAVFTGFGGSTYYYKIYPFTNSGSFINYKTDGSVPQFSVTNSNAPSLPITENFLYVTGSNLTANGWVAHSGAGNLPIQVNASPLSYSGYINSGIGKSVSLTPPGLASAEDVNRAFDTVSTGSIYASFMVSVDSATTDEVYFFHFGPENSTTAFFGKAFVKNDGSGNLAFGVAKNSNTSALFTAFSYALNTTYLVVVKYTFNSGSTTDDEVKLWINPVLNGTEPAADLTQTDTQIDPVSLGFFALRQATNGPGLTLGGLRISNTWVPSAPPATFSMSVTIQNGWNLVSIPGLHPTNQNVNTWWAFRDISTDVYKFNGGYQVVTTVSPGEGYWMKHNGFRLYNTGDEWPSSGILTVIHSSINANSGWNMIGGYEQNVPTSNITTIPGGLQSGFVFGYSPISGYTIASTLDRGYGYWIYLTGAGEINIPSGSQSINKVRNLSVENFGKILITDREGKNYTLYVVNEEVYLDAYKLPPAPPAGLFDIRYGSGRFAEDLKSGNQSIEMNGIEYPIKLTVDGLSLNIKDETGEIVNSYLRSGEKLIINDNTITKLFVSSNETTPTEYSLDQNYPNPFNPSTKIRYNLPTNELVSLKIYNTIGEEVASLVNEQQQAGNYEIEFNATGLASGIYLYKIVAGNFVSTKKMILLK